MPLHVPAYLCVVTRLVFDKTTLCETENILITKNY